MTPTTSPQWTSAQLGLTVFDTGVDSSQRATDLVVPGLRRNPRRAHLLVSTVLGKHIPTDPRLVREAAEALGDLAADAVRRLAPGIDAEDATVFGFAETATGLGHGVAAHLRSRCYLQSTRRADPEVVVHGQFTEGHSHATTHLIQATFPSRSPGCSDPTEKPAPSGPLILVDDEISTGATAIDAIVSLHAIAPHSAYVVASLVDMRSDADRTANAAAATALGVDIEFVALATGWVALPDGLPAAVAELDTEPLNPVAAKRGSTEFLRIDWPPDVPDGGRFGFLADDLDRFTAAVADAATQISTHLAVGDVVVVGHEELMYLPQRIAEALATNGRTVGYQTTTRSPAVVLDDPGYPLRRGFEFIAPEPDSTARRYLYNATLDAESPTQIVLVIDTPADTPELRAADGVLDVLARAGHDVLVAVIPSPTQAGLLHARSCESGSTVPTPITTPPLTGPNFGSYAADEATWLLKDLSGADLEADVTLREKRIQAGTAHYAESLPIEYQPTDSYRRLFDETLAASASRLAEAVGTVTELLIADRGRDLTLVSLARAGTPVGVLMRRWAAQRHGLDWPHYAVSIVRDRGIDTAALDYLVAHHDPASIVFVDGWTGKGAISKELSEALREYAVAGGPVLNDDLAVLADPGSCVRTYGTRSDFLIASACLNSTVSGLVSRTVLNDALIGPGEFHGAKFYRELAPFDVSNTLLDMVSAQFDAVAESAADRAAAIAESDRTPTWSGWASVEAVRERYGISSVNFVKPGVGETTRVLLRRVPWKILVRDADAAEHAHIRLLATDRGVPVEVVDDLAYSCMGLIAPVDGDAQ